MLERIVIINDLASPKGGASLLAVQSSLALAQRGHRVTLVSGDDGPASRRGGVEHVSLGHKRLLESGAAKALARGLHNGTAEVMVRDWIARNDGPGTVYHLHGWSQILSPAVFRALAPVWDRLIMSAHDFFLTCPNGAMYDYRRRQPCQRQPLGLSCITARCDRRSYSHKMWRIARHAALPRMVRSAPPPQLLIHEGMRPYLALGGVQGKDMIVLPNPVTPFQADRVVAERNRDVLFVGRLEETKGIEVAAQACRLARARLVAVGDGALLDRMRRDYPEMSFAGRRAQHEIGAIARTARMLVMPSQYMEPFGLTAVEAMWSGLPVLLSRQALIAADAEMAGAAVAIEPHDPASFAPVIAQLCADDERTRKMSLAAHEQTGHLALDAERWTDALAAIYQALAEGGREALEETARAWHAPSWADPADQAQDARGAACALP